MSGALGRQVVVKQYAGNVVVSKYPDMSGIKPSRGQKAKRGKFREAVVYAQAIINNPKRKAAYSKTLPAGTSVYHAAIKDYLTKNK